MQARSGQCVLGVFPTVLGDLFLTLGPGLTSPIYVFFFTTVKHFSALEATTLPDGSFLLEKAPNFDAWVLTAAVPAPGTDIVADCPDVATVCVPVGGGGLIAGIAVHAKAVNPAIRIIARATDNRAIARLVWRSVGVKCTTSNRSSVATLVRQQ